MPYKDPEKQRAAQARYYQDNKDLYKARNKVKRSKIRQYVMDIKASTPCYDCGETFPYYIMDFDHRDPQKKQYGIANWANSVGSLDALKREIEKCDVVCANCHRHRTWKQQHKQREGQES